MKWSGRYLCRLLGRNPGRSILSLLLAALLAFAFGVLSVLRGIYSELYQNVEIKADFSGGMSYTRAVKIAESGYVRDPYCEILVSGGQVELSLETDVILTNRLDKRVTEPVEWLEGWDEESAMAANGKTCILPAPFMEEMELELGDEFRINERDVMSHLLADGTPAPGTPEEALALRDARRPKYTVIGRIETLDSQWLAVAPAASFQYYASYLAAELYFDSAEYKLCSYYEAEEFREYARELLLSAKNPPEFRMDTSDADRLYRSYRLVETLYPFSVAAALILGTALPVLTVAQSRREAAVLRALGWPRRDLVGRYASEQGTLCLLGLLLALLALFAVNGGEFLAVLRPALGYMLVHLVLCVVASAAISASILQKSPMRLLQAKE